MSTSSSSWWKVVLRWLLGPLLLWAAVGKLANLQEFYVQLAAYRLPLPMALLRGVAMVLPWMELLCGLLLLVGLRTRGALVWSLAMFVIFSICTGQAWYRGLKITCGCLDLRFIGLHARSSMAQMLESVEFAFLRAVALALVAALLLMSGGDSGVRAKKNALRDT